MKTHRIPPLLPLLLALLVLPSFAIAQQKERKRERDPQAAKPTPDLANHHYGPHARHVLDLWKAKSETPTPLVVYIHGGGFRAGSKDSISPSMLKALLERGISVMAVNYRFSPEVTFPAHYMDCARAIQFARLHAKDWNLNPNRVGSTGGSAGAGTSLWLGFHNDMADPDNADPVLRQPTRLSCMAVMGAQSTYDPHVISEWIGEAAARHPALEGFYGITRDQFGTAAAREMFNKAAPITYLTKDDPPVIAFYNEPRGPLPENASPGQGIHHINFGHKLKEQMDPLGIECTIRHADERPDLNRETVEFFVKHLQATP